MDIEVLRTALESEMVGLNGVSWKRMFGCDAAFRYGSIFAMVWKQGRLALKFPTAEEFDILISHPGSNRRTPGGRTTKHWVLLPDAVVKNREELRDWVQIAHGSCR